MNRPKPKIILSVLVVTIAGICGTSAGVSQLKAVAAAKSAAEIDLPALLQKAAEYCRKLEGSIFDFFCREEIEETIDVTLETNKPGGSSLDQWKIGGRITSIAGKVSKFKNSFVYD